MTQGYGVRYLKVDDFIKYCESVNIKTDTRELEYYEKIGIMLPIVRTLFPEEYVRNHTLWFMSVIDESPNNDKWPEISRLSDKRRVLPEQYADLTNDELIDSFDREMGKNPCLIQPSITIFRPWDSYTIEVPIRDGIHHTASLAEHYFGYWQIHQLYNIQQYPDLYKNKAFLDHMNKAAKKRYFRPWTPEPTLLREFNGLARAFDMISYWITVYTRERDRTFALAPVNNQIKRLDATQFEAYRKRLSTDANLVRNKFLVTIDDLYEFLFKFIELYDDYRKDEHYKLSEELKNDIIYLAQLIESLSGNEWEAIGDELGIRYTYWTKQHFLHIDISIKERDAARGLLISIVNKYNDVLAKINITHPTQTFSEKEIDDLLNFCRREGFSILATSLSGMIATQEEFAEKFRRVYLYSNIKNTLTSLEYLLKDLARRGGINVASQTLNPTIQIVMKKEAWNKIFTQKTKMGFVGAKTSADFFSKLNILIHDPDLLQSEDAFWARVFLITSLARNLTVHTYPDDDWFYGELFSEILQAISYALIYSWKKAIREGWVITT